MASLSSSTAPVFLTRFECLACFLRHGMSRGRDLTHFAALGERTRHRANLIAAETKAHFSTNFPHLVESPHVAWGLEAQRIFEIEMTDAERAAMLTEARHSNFVWIEVPPADWPLKKEYAALKAAKAAFQEDRTSFLAWCTERLREQERLAQTESTKPCTSCTA